MTLHKPTAIPDYFISARFYKHIRSVTNIKPRICVGVKVKVIS